MTNLRLSRFTALMSRVLFASLVLTLIPIGALSLPPEDAEAVGPPIYACANIYTSSLRYSPTGSCIPNEILVDLNGDPAVTVCAHVHTGFLRYSPTATCTPIETLLTLPGENATNLCLHPATGRIRYAPSGACPAGESVVLVPQANDPPVAADDAFTTDEDVPVSGNVLADNGSGPDTDIEGDPLSVNPTPVSGPANGSVVLNSDGSFTYTPNPDFFGTDSFTYQLLDGEGGTDTGMVTITVDPVNDAPVANDDTATVLEDSGPNAIDVLANDDDVDGDDLDLVGFTGPSNGIVVLDPVTDMLTYTPDPDFNGVDSFIYTISDPDGQTDTATVTITVDPVNDAPIANDQAAATNEDVPVVITLTGSDADGDPLSFAIATAPANGSLSAITPVDATSAQVTYTPDPDFNGPDSFTFTANDGTVDSAPATVSITVDSLNDAPVVDDQSFSIAENSANGLSVGIVVATDPDTGQSLTFAITAGNTGGAFAINPSTGEITVANSAQLDFETNPSFSLTVEVSDNGVPSMSDTATITVNVTNVNEAPVANAQAVTTDEDVPVVITLTGSDVDGDALTFAIATGPTSGTLGAITQLTPTSAQVTHTPNGDFSGADSFTFTVNDGTLDSPAATVSITVNAVDDPPTAFDDTATVAEDSGATAIDVLANDVDPDGGLKQIIAVQNPSDAGGTVLITGGGSGLTYEPAADYCNTPPGTTPDTFTYTLSPGGSTATVSVTVNCINDPPLAGADAFDFIGNTELRVDQSAPTTPTVLAATGSGDGVLDNDSEPEGDSFTLTGITVGACTDTAAPFACSDPAVGTVSMNADGTFSFIPAPGDTDATETFEYTITDDGLPAPASADGAVTLTRFERVWYVDPAAGVNGDGASASPFNTLDGLDGAGDADLDGDYLFVHDGTLAMSGPLPMEANQRLLGEGVGLSIPVDLNGNGSPTNLVAAGAQPQLSNAGGNTVAIGSAIPAEIRGLSLAAGTGNSIDLTSAAALTGSSTLLIGSNEFRGAGAEDIDVNLNVGTSGTLDLDIQSNTWDGTDVHAGNAIDIALAAGNLDLNISDNTGILSLANAVVIEGGAVGATTISGFANNSVSGDTGGLGVTINDVTFGGSPNIGGTLAIGASGNPVGGLGLQIFEAEGNLFFDDLDIFAGTSGLSVSGQGPGLTFGVQPTASGGSSTIEAGNGPAVDATIVELDLRLARLVSTTTTAGIFVFSVDGQLSAPAGSSITKTSGTGPAFSISTANTVVTYGGTLNVSSGSGVRLVSIGSGSTTFSGQMTLNTGANPAFEAALADTLVVTGGPNILTTTTAIALNVANTTIGAGGLNFQSISSSGAGSPGIVLNNTGGTAGLTVTGAGSAGSGGTIQNTSGDGIALTNTANVSLNWMTIANTGRHGVLGTGVTDASGGVSPSFELRNSLLDSPGDADNESALFFDTLGVTNITGRMVVAGTTIQNFEDVGIHVGNVSGALVIDVTDVIINNNSDTNGEEGIDVEANGTANITLNVTGTLTGNTSTTTFTDLEGGGINAIVQNSGTLDLNLTGVVDSGTGGPDDFPTPPIWTFAAEGSASTLTFDITNNRLVDSPGDGIFVGHEGTIQGRITGNTISGMELGDGIRIDTDITSNTTSTILIENNDIGNDATFPGIGGDGIQVLHRDGTKTLNLTINNNRIANTDSEGIRYFTDDDVGGGGPSNFLHVTSNTFSNTGTEDLSDSIVIISQDSGTEVCAHINANVTVEGITLQQTLSAVLQITQASTAALATANGGATVTVVAGSTITFNGTCTTPTLPTNP